MPKQDYFLKDLESVVAASGSQRWRTIAEEFMRDSQRGIVILDEKQRIKVWSSGAEKIFGFLRADVVNRNIEFLVPPEFNNQSEAMVDEIDKNNHLKNIEGKRFDKDGNLIDVLISATKITEDKKVFYLVIYTDISQQNKTTGELQKRFEAIQGAYRELGLQRRQSDYLGEIAALGVNGGNFNELSNLIVSSISLLTLADAAVFRLHDKKSGLMKLQSYLGVSPKWSAKGPIPFKNSLAEDAFKKKEPMLIDNVGSSMKYKGLKLLKAHKFSTMITIPLYVGKEFCGSLNLYAKNPDKFRLLETDFLSAFGRVVSLALYVRIHQGV